MNRRIGSDSDEEPKEKKTKKYRTRTRNHEKRSRKVIGPASDSDESGTGQLEFYDVKMVSIFLKFEENRTFMLYELTTVSEKANL